MEDIFVTDIRKWLSVIVLYLFCSWFIKYNWNRRKQYKYSWSVPGQIALPMIGNAFQYGGSTQANFETLHKAFKHYATPGRLWLGNKLFALIARPEDVELILKSPHALEKADSYKFFLIPVGYGLVTSPVSIWKPHRKIINAAFNQKILDAFVDIFVEQTNIFIVNMKPCVGKGKLDIYKRVADCTLDMLCESAFGIKLCAQNQDSILMNWITTGTDIIIKRAFCLWYQSDFIFNLLPESKTLYNGRDDFNRFAGAIIEQKRKAIEEKKKLTELDYQPDTIISERRAFLDLLLEYTDGEKIWTDEDLISEVKTLLVAGTDTTASLMSFCCMMLGYHVEIQDRVYDEILDVLQDDIHRDVTPDDLPKFQHLDRVLKETMRLFPPIPLMGRKTTADLPLSTCTIPEDTQILMSVLHLHRDAEFWAEPLKFNPDRFLPEEIQKIHPFAYIPFSGGARNCVGFKYGEMQMKAFFATFLRTYKLKANYKVEDIRLIGNLMLKASDGFMIELELRNPK